MSSTPAIRIQHLRQVLQWRRRMPVYRWAAHTGVAVTNACVPRPAGGGHLIWDHTVVLPMNRGYLANAYARVCQAGQAELVATFGRPTQALVRQVNTYTMEA